MPENKASEGAGPPKKATNAILYLIVGVLVLALIGVGVYFLMNRPADEKTETADEETEETTISLDKTQYDPGEEMVVTYSVVESIEDDAWIGIVPSNTPHGDEEDGDASDISYEYLRGKKDGELKMFAPYESGKYDVRIYDSDSGGKELGYVTFEVSAVVESENNVSIEKTVYEQGERIIVTYTTDGTFDTSAWIGIVPSNIPHGSEEVNDQNDISYQYIPSVSGTLTFYAPDEPGEYDFRMHPSDSGGAPELAYVSFTVR